MTRKSSSAEIAPVAPCEYGDSKRDCSLNELLDGQADLHHSHQQLCKIVKELHQDVKGVTKQLNRISKKLGVSLVMVLAFALTACKTTSLKTSTVLEVESKYRVMDTGQQCGSALELIPLVEQAWPVILDEMAKAGIVKDPSKLEAGLKGTFRRGAVRVCLLSEPDVCGPCKPGSVSSDLCARKRGCADSFRRSIWVSRWWPPMCRGDWPSEPHCVLPGAPRSSDFRSDLVAEMGNFIWQASGGKENYHGNDAVLKAIAAANKRLGW